MNKESKPLTDNYKDMAFASKYSAAIFDMDGTILDTLEDLKCAINFALRVNGFPERTTDEVRNFVGNGLEKLVQRAVYGADFSASNLDSTSSSNSSENGNASGNVEILKKVRDSFDSYYKDHCYDHTKPYDGIVEAVKKLKSCGLKVAVCSNKPDYGVQELCQKFFPGIFDCAMGISEGRRIKPNPDCVSSILEKFQIPQNDAVYIGDSDVDIKTAENAGLDSISVCWGFRSRIFLEEHGAKCIVSDANELLKKIIWEK